MEKSGKSSPWFLVLIIITLVHTTAFLLVTLIQFRNIEQLQTYDDKLYRNINELTGKHRADVSKTPDEGGIVQSHQKRSSSNFFSELLNSQEKVIAQHCIDKHKACANGSKGEIGDPGERGLIGQKGTKGAAGQQGGTGPKGQKGDKGAPGNNGTQGIPGEQGNKGSEGSKGDLGIRGNQGQKGERGNIGPKGDIGRQGFQGFVGSQGSKGDKGSFGEKGLPGYVGIKGEKGDIGFIGPPGHDGKIVADGCQCLKKAKINQFPNDQTILSGQDAEMTCQVTGNPKPNVIWFKDGDHIYSDSSHSVTSNSLRLFNPSTNDTGEYICQAENPISVTSSKPWKITVL